MWRFLWRPRWLFSHLLVLALIVTLVNLGFWQLRRLDERRGLNRIVAARLADAPVPIEDVADPATDRFRRVVVDGTVEDTVVVNNRSLDGSPGLWNVVVVGLGGGHHVLVNRGFIAAGELPGQVPDVHVEGYLVSRDRLDRSARIDLDPALDRDGVLPVLVQQMSPAPQAPLFAVAPPDLGEGPHLGYAVQWFIFATIAVVGYPIILRRVARERRDEAAGARHDLDRELEELLADGG
jgi:surfeit locus 1 family protein